MLFDAAGDVATGYAVSSLAQVYLRTGDAVRAEEQAQIALRLLDGREDVLEEIGNVQLVLGRALSELGRLDEAEDAFAAAETSFSNRESSACSLPPGWRAASSRSAVTTPSAPPRSTARRRKPSRTPTSRRRRPTCTSRSLP